MPKRVLIAENSAVIRGVAETLLRQNGYEVLSVGTYEKALEVLSFTRPDLLVIGGDLANNSGQKLYEHIQRDGKTASVPMLLFRNPEDMSLPFPDEVLVSRPFESRDFIEKVQIFCGQTNQAPTRETVNPLNVGSLDDEFLDAALGLDRIDVTHSEIMSKTSGMKQQKQQPTNTETFLGMGHQEQDQMNRSSKVESLMIKADATSISSHNAAGGTGKPTGGTSKIEIVDDQYGMVDPQAFHPQQKQENHDYNWFINEMKNESNPQSAKAASSSGPSFGSASGPIKTTTVPVTPAIKTSAPIAGGKGRTVGVEKFIDEFKREIERFRSDESDPVPDPSQAPGQKQSGSSIVWEETVERLNADAVGLFTKQLANDLAEKLAQKIVSKIDPDKLLVLIKNELMEQAKKKQ